MSELTVGSLSGLAANSYVIDVASGSTLDLSAGAVFPAGSIIQVVRATDATARTTTSTTFVDANISVTITPRSASSAIIVIWSAVTDTTGLAIASITDSSNVALSGAEFTFSADGSTEDSFTSIGYSTPSTTSPVTYKGRFRTSAAGSASLDNNLQTGQMYAIEVSG